MDQNINSRGEARTSNIIQIGLIAALVIAAFVIGSFWSKIQSLEKGSGETNNGQANNGAAQPSPTGTPAVSLKQIKSLFADKSNIVFGDPNRKVIFVEFSDPSCPYCHIASGTDPELNKEAGSQFLMKQDGGSYVPPVPEMKKLVDEGKAAYAWVFSPGHGSGELATQAFYCAQDQGKFWQVHDLIMSNKGYNLLNDTVKNDVSKAPQLVDLLKDVVNTQQMQECLTSGKYAGRIKTDEQIATSFGVQGTPSFFVNDKNFAGAYSYTNMQSAVDEALK
jgi:protein-disulfide isomerase